MLNIRTLARSCAATALMAVSITASTMVAAPSAQADPVIPIDWTVDVTSHLAKLNKDLTVPTGTFKGGFDLATSTITGDLALPQATSRLDLGSLPLANVTLALEQTAPVTGTVDLATLTASTTATYNVRIVAIRPLFAPWVNLVKSTCVTRTPVSAGLAGPVDLTNGSTFSGAFDLGKFSGCGLGVNEIVNGIVPGPGNTITARFTPTA